MPSRSGRWLSVEALDRWERGRGFAEEIVHTLQAEYRPDPAERAFLMELFYGVLRNMSRLDHWIATLRKGTLDADARNCLRIGLHQVFNLRVPDHAAVNETVAVAGRARGLVNAVLRRAIREREPMLAAIEQAPLALRTSHPAFLVDRWVGRMGEKPAADLCAWNNAPAPVYVRANGLRVTRGELAASYAEAEPAAFHESALRVRHLPPSWIIGGLCYVQDPSTLLACDLLAPVQGETVLDACAAPGGKTSYLAEQMQNRGRIHACDVSPARLETLAANLERLGVRNTRTTAHDWLGDTPPPFERASFDRILLDAPCSNTGVMRRRVDVRWRLTPADFKKMHGRQTRMAAAVAPLLKPGGVLVYSTCSLEMEENEATAKRIARENPDLQLETTRSCSPLADAVDGAFAARFVRKP
jgi:16S rRNA (cytosine967-C5)-methyltransferase